MELRVLGKLGGGVRRACIVLRVDARVKWQSLKDLEISALLSRHWQTARANNMQSRQVIREVSPPEGTATSGRYRYVQVPREKLTTHLSAVSRQLALTPTVGGYSHQW